MTSSLSLWHRRYMLVFLVLAMTGGVLVVSGTADAAVDGQYFFTGEQEDQVNKASCAANNPNPCEPTATFAKAPPDADTIIQTMSPNCAKESAANYLCAFWVGSYTGTIDGDVDLCWYWSTTNAAAAGLGVDVEVTVWGDPTYQPKGGEQAAKIIGRAEATLAVGADPVENVTTIPIKGTVATHMLIQVVPLAPDTGTGNAVHYGSADAPSAFAPKGKACDAAGPQPSGSPTASPSPTGSPAPGGARHARKITINFKQGSLIVFGVVKVPDGFNACRSKVPVKIKRLVSGRYVSAGAGTTKTTGKYSVEVPDDPGRYHARATKVKKGTDTCKTARASKQHRP